MSKMNKRATKAVGWILGVVALLLTLCISFGGNIGLGFVPTWAEIYSAFGLLPENRGSYVAVVDVGDADCTVVCSDGMCAVIDTGDVGDNGNAVLQFLQSQGIKQVDYLVLSHYHSDHIGGANAIAENLPVGIVLLPPLSGNEEETQLTERLLNTVDNRKIKTETLAEGMNFSVGEFGFNVLLCREDIADENDRSAVISAKIKDTTLLFMGDATDSTEKILLANYPELSADILKVGHHGSATSSSEEFINAVNPKYAAVSCGTRWESVPSVEVLNRLYKVGATVNRTDIDSHIFYYFENGGVRIETGR